MTPVLLVAVTLVGVAGTVVALTGTASSPPIGPAPAWSLAGTLLAVGGVLAATGIAAIALRDNRSSLRRATMAVSRPAVAALRAVHSGHIGDYVAWMFAALSVLATVLAVQLR